MTSRKKLIENIDDTKKKLNDSDVIRLTLEMAEFLTPEQFSEMFEIAYETEDEEFKKKIELDVKDFLKNYFQKIHLAKKLIK